MADTLRISSITGVDLDFRIAGPGGRSYAFVIDWHIRVVLMLAWYVLGMLLVSGTLRWTAEVGPSYATFMLVIVMPATAIYVLYHPVLEVAMNGRTPGKRIAGVRIINQSGEVPGVGAILIRNVLRILDSLPAFYAIGLTATIFTEQSVRIGDMAAGTLLVYDDAEPGAVSAFESGAIEKVGLKQLELARELLDRWPELEPEVRIRLGNRLLANLGLAQHGDAEDVLDALQQAASG